MKRKISLLFMCVFSFCLCLVAKQVDQTSALNVASNFLASKVNLRSSANNLKLVYTEKDTFGTRNGQSEKSYYYIFSINDNKGFIIVSADDINAPVIGYSLENSFDPNNQPDNFKAWMGSIVAGTKEAITNNEKQTPVVKQLWEDHLSGNLKQPRNTKAVAALVQTKWNQGIPYNNSIPVTSNGSKFPIGCVATAMAQIMKYHNHPTKGMKATPAYITRTLKLSMPSINLPQYTYDWANMANKYNYGGNNTIQDNAVALLMYHCATSVKMDYQIGGSGAFTSDLPNAFIEYFGYDRSISLINRNAYTNQEWIQLLKSEIDNKRPFYYSGTNDSGGSHAFVCDGYDDANAFHFNWGWGGVSDGSFTLENMLYKNYHSAVINIKPNTGQNLEPNYSAAHIFQSIEKPIHKNERFNVRMNINKTNNSLYNSEFALSLYDLNGNLVLSNINQAKMEEDGSVSFASVIPSTVPAGKYILQPIFKTESNIWKLATIGAAFTDKYKITVSNTVMNNQFGIRLSGIETTEKRIYKADETIPLSIDVKNCTDKDFSGKVSVLLEDKLSNVIELHNKNVSWSGGFGTFHWGTVPTMDATIPSDLKPGDYTLYFGHKVATNKWDRIESAYLSKQDTLQIKIIGEEVVQSDLRMIDDGIDSWVNKATEGDEFDILANYSNVGTIDFTGYDAVSLISKKTGLKTIISTNSNEIRTVKAGQNVRSSMRTIIIPKGIAPGMYELRAASKSIVAGSDWVFIDAAPGSGVPDRVDFEVVDPAIAKHHMIMEKVSQGIAGVTSKKVKAAEGESFITSSQYHNRGTKTFNGIDGIFLIDKKTGQRTLISEKSYHITLGINTDKGYTELKCTIPTGTAPGMYELRAAVKADGINTEWEIIDALAGSGITDRIDFEVIDTNVSQSDLVMTLRYQGLFISIAQTAENERFSVFTRYTNIGTKDFTGHTGVFLIDKKTGQRTLISETLSYIPTVKAGGNADPSIMCTVPSGTAPGIYELRAATKSIEPNSDWVYINAQIGSGLKDRISLEVLDPTTVKYDIKMNASYHGVYPEKRQAVENEQFNTVAKYTNIGKKSFKGTDGVFLINKTTRQKFLISIKTYVTGLTPSSDIGSNITCAIPTGMAPGVYEMRAAIKSDGVNTEWEFIDATIGSGAIDRIDFEILASKDNSKLGLVSENDVVVYPNPTSNELQVKSPNEIKNVKLTNLSGQVVLNDKGQGYTYQTTIQHLTNGIYILRVETDKGFTTHKIIKK